MNLFKIIAILALLLTISKGFSQTGSTKKNLDINNGNGIFPIIKYPDYSSGTGTNQNNNGKNDRLKPDQNMIRPDKLAVQSDSTITTIK